MNFKVVMMAGLAICGCSKMSENVIVQEEKETVELRFNVPAQKTTRVSGAVEEDAVTDLQIYVFGLDGQLQAYGHSESEELTLTCNVGEKRIAALVNAPLHDNVTSESALNMLVSSFSENSIGKFVMSGIQTKTVSSSGVMTIPVSRLVSKVSLVQVRNDFEMEQHKNMDFAIKSVFLTNAAADRKYMSSSAPSGWYNKGLEDMSQIISQSGTMMYESLGSVKIAAGKAHSAGNVLYCYPNPLADGADPTYLVVEATLGQTLYYYPVALPAMESNKCYNVSLTVRHPGSSAPDVPVENTDVVFSVEVLPWAGNISVNETI